MKGIQHLVFFKLKDSNKETLDFVKGQLNKLKDISSHDNTLEVHEGFTSNQGVNGDLVLVSVFKSKEFLDAYMADGLHKDVIKLTAPHIEKKYVFDFLVN